MEWHDETALAVYSAPPDLRRLWALPGVRRWQVGDQEARALVPVDRLSEAATLIRARRRRPGRPLTTARPSGFAPAYWRDFARLGAVWRPRQARGFQVGTPLRH